MTTLIVRPTPQALAAGNFFSALEEALQGASIECVITAVGNEHRVHVSDAYQPRQRATGDDAFDDVVDALERAGLRATVSEASKAPPRVVLRSQRNITSMGIPPGGIFGGVFDQVDSAANDPFSEPPSEGVKAAQSTRPRFH